MKQNGLVSKTSLRKNFLRGSIVIGILLALGFGIRSFKGDPKGKIKTAKVETKDVVQSLILSGKIFPEKTMVITAQQSGRIVSLDVKEGAKVAANDLLFSMQLEAAGQNELMAMRSKVKGLEQEVASSSRLVKNKSLVKELIGVDQVAREESDLEKLRIDLASTREQLRVVEANLGLNQPRAAKNSGMVYVRSPIEGIVTLVDKRPGDFVLGGAGMSSGETGGSNERMVMVVADMNHLQVKIRVMENDIRFVSKGLAVKIRLDAYPDIAYEGKVEQIGGQGRMEPSAGYTYFDVYVAIDQKDARLLPEMNATVNLIFAEQKDTLSLPVADVLILPTASFVRLADKNSEKGYRLAAVQTGVISTTDVQIVSGLKEGDEVQEIDFSSTEILESAQKQVMISDRTDKSRDPKATSTK